MTNENVSDSSCCGPGYASPADAIAAPREKLLYTVALYTGTGIQQPDYLATLDADPESPTYSEVIHHVVARLVPKVVAVGDVAHRVLPPSNDLEVFVDVEVTAGCFALGVAEERDDDL